MTTNHCPNCQTAIPAGAPGGFCPACVLRGAEESAPVTAQGGPSLEEVRAAFPQLEIEGLIGQGGMGSVYKARQPSLDRIVALKILSPALSRDPAFAERFAREARVLGRLSHPNIVTVYEHGQSGGFYYLLMEYVDGVNLRQAMQAGRFTPEQALAVVPGICDALQAAHAEGIWHRDIKPENILLDARGGVKIADFGIARLAGDPQQAFTLTMTGARLGSAAYMAPEQHEKPHDVDHRADIYSLGVVIYEMLTGELPLGRFKAPSTKAAVDARIDEIVLRTLEKERELRQQSAAEVKTGVADAASSPPCPPQEVRRSSMPVTFRLAMTAGFVLLVSSGFLTYGSAQGVLMSVSLVLIVVGLTGAFIYRGKTPHLRISRGVAGAFLVFVLLGAGWIYVEQKRQRAELEAEAAHRSRLVLAALEARRAEKSVNKKAPESAEERAGDSGRNWDEALLQRPDGEGEINNVYWQWPNQMKQAELAKQKGDLVEALRLFELSASSADTERTHAEEGYRKQGKDPGRWPAMRRNWSFWQSKANAGDMLCRLNRLKEAGEAYSGAIAALDELLEQNKLQPNFKPERVREALASCFIKLGDVTAAQSQGAAAITHYRAAADVMGSLDKGAGWALDPKGLEFGPDMSVPLNEEELVRLVAKTNGEPNDYSGDDWQRLRDVLGLVCAEKAVKFRHLLEDKKLLAAHPLSMAAIDWSLNGNGKALDFILNSLAKQSVGADCDEPCVLAYMDEWERSAPAVDAHFTQTDGAGGINLGDFWVTRQYYFPRNYLRYKFPRLEGAPLQKQ